MLCVIARSVHASPLSKDGLLRFGNDELMTPRTATLIGLTAILMWSLLAALTVATGKIPAFQLAAMTFAIGALVIGPLTWIGRPEAIRALWQPPLAWIVGVGGLCSVITRCISWRCASRLRPKPAC